MNIANRLRPVLERPLLLGACFGALGGFFIDALRGDMFGILGGTAIVLIGILIGVLCGAFHALEIEAATVGALALIYFVVAFTPLADSIAVRWVRDDPLPASTDAVVVLSSGVLADSALNATGVDRLLSGLTIARRLDAPRIITSQVRGIHDHVVVTSATEQRRLIALAGLASRWAIIDSVHSTHDEALQSARALLPAARRIVLVTSPMHTRRACRVFEAVGFVVTCAAATEHTYLTWHPASSADRLASFAWWVYERLGIFKYTRMGWFKVAVPSPGA
jgi:uncharacterized SAM-binding protein YcdF (DUF218 family)